MSLNDIVMDEIIEVSEEEDLIIEHKNKVRKINSIKTNTRFETVSIHSQTENYLFELNEKRLNVSNPISNDSEVKNDNKIGTNTIEFAEEAETCSDISNATLFPFETENNEENEANVMNNDNDITIKYTNKLLLEKENSNDDNASILNDNNTLFENYETQMELENGNSSSSEEETNDVPPRKSLDYVSDSEEDEDIRFYTTLLKTFCEYDDKNRSKTDENDIIIEEPKETQIDVDETIIYTKDTIDGVMDRYVTNSELVRIKHIQKNQPLFVSYNSEENRYHYVAIKELLCIEKHLSFKPYVNIIGFHTKTDDNQHILLDKKFNMSLKLFFTSNIPICDVYIGVFGSFDSQTGGVYVHFWKILNVTILKRLESLCEKIRGKQINKCDGKCIKCIYNK